MLSGTSMAKHGSLSYKQETSNMDSSETPELLTVDDFLARFREHSSNIIANAYK
jgi:hypothetical protein